MEHYDYSLHITYDILNLMAKPMYGENTKKVLNHLNNMINLNNDEKQVCIEIVNKLHAFCILED